MVELTSDQKEFVLENWNTMGLLALTRRTFLDNSLNGRSLEAKSVQKFLGERKVKKKNESIELSLTDDQKEYVQTSISSLTPHEVAKIIFDNPKLEPLSQEVRLVTEYAKTLDNKGQFPHEDYAKGEYRPPDQLSAVVTKVNHYLRKDLSLKTMPTIQRKAMEAIRNFIHAPRFLLTINSYIAQKTRDMFEGEFIRTVFDKPDLTTDELNIAITLCQHYVMGVNIHRHLDLLNTRYEETLNDPKSTGLQSLAEMVKAKATELKECNKAQTELTKFLSGVRSQRQEKQGGSQNSVARLVEWFQDEQERKKALQRAELQAKEDEEEVDRIESIPELKARILGMSRSELLHG